MNRILLLAIFVTIVSVSACVTSGNAIVSKNYTCDEFRELIASERKTLVKTLLGATEVSRSPRSCGFRSVPSRSTWRTSDVTFCSAGFICRIDLDDDDD